MKKTTKIETKTKELTIRRVRGGVRTRAGVKAGVVVEKLGPH